MFAVFLLCSATCYC